MTSTAAAFAGRLRHLREGAGLSQYEMARRTGLSKQTLSRLEMGGREPSWVTVRLLAHALGVSVTEFEAGDLPLPTAGTAAQKARPGEDGSATRVRRKAARRV